MDADRVTMKLTGTHPDSVLCCCVGDRKSNYPTGAAHDEGHMYACVDCAASGCWEDTPGEACRVTGELGRWTKDRLR